MATSPDVMRTSAVQIALATVRCPHRGCRRIQFRAPGRDHCIVCQRPLDTPEPETPLIAASPLEAAPTVEEIRAWSDEMVRTIMRERLRAIRNLKGYSQSSLARAVPCPRTYISKIEKGGGSFPTLAVWCRLASALGITMYQLCDFATPALTIARATIASGPDGEFIRAIAEAAPGLPLDARHTLVLAARDLATKGQTTFEEWVRI